MTDEMIEELMKRNGEKYPYKIGDRVILKGSNRCATITDLKYNSWGNLSYYIKIDNDKDISIDCPTELLLPYDNKVKGLVENKLNKDMKKIWYCPRGYEFKDENGNIINTTKIVLEKKKKEYPKTYEECLVMTSYDKEERLLYLLDKFKQLLICRDAYWKIAGEEMGLGKPWKPNWEGKGCYVIVNHRGNIVTDIQWHANAILAFPTEEMRDTFYENFKSEIERCKELL